MAAGSIITPMEKKAKLQIDNHYVSKIISDLSRAINDELEKTVQRSGKNMVIYTIPEFTLYGVSKADGQRIIHSKIISDIEDAGYNVKICVDQGKHPLLIIEWESILDEEKAKRMTDYILQHKISGKELAELRSKS